MTNNMFLPNQIFNSLRIVHTNEIWQENESGWCNISVYNDKDELIAQGRDMITFKGNQFSMECKKDIEGFICYGAKFKMPPTTYHNNLEIEVI